MKRSPWLNAFILILIVVSIAYFTGNLNLPFTTSPYSGTLTVMEPDWGSINCETGEGQYANFKLSSNNLLEATCSAYVGQSDKCTVQAVNLLPCDHCALRTMVDIIKDDQLIKDNYYLLSDGTIRQSWIYNSAGYNVIYTPNGETFDKNFKIKVLPQVGGDEEKFKSASGAYKQYWRVLKYRSSAQGSISYAVIPNTEGCYWRDVDSAIRTVSNNQAPTRSNMQQLQNPTGFQTIPITLSGQMQTGVTYAFVIGYHGATLGGTIFDVGA